MALGLEILHFQVFLQQENLEIMEDMMAELFEFQKKKNTIFNYSK